MQKRNSNPISSYVDQDYVWYACYGSNISSARFMRYINSCTDKTPPVEARAYEFPHNIYFAAESKTWKGKAVAFLDDSEKGFAFFYTVQENGKLIDEMIRLK